MRKNVINGWNEVRVNARYGSVVRASRGLREEIDYVKKYFADERQIRLSDAAASEIIAREYKMFRNQKKFFGGGLF